MADQMQKGEANIDKARYKMDAATMDYISSSNATEQLAQQRMNAAVPVMKSVPGTGSFLLNAAMKGAAAYAMGGGFAGEAAGTTEAVNSGTIQGFANGQAVTDASGQALTNVSSRAPITISSPNYAGGM